MIWENIFYNPICKQQILLDLCMIFSRKFKLHKAQTILHTYENDLRNPSIERGVKNEHPTDITNSQQSRSRRVSTAEKEMESL